MAEVFKQSFAEGVDLDSGKKRIKQTKALFIKNMTANVNVNPGAAAGAGYNLGVYTPLEKTTQLPVTLPSGRNYCIGFFSSEQTNEGYAFIFNSSNQHCILVIDGETGNVRIVYKGPLLPFVLDPQYFLTEGRVVLELRSFVDKVTGKESYFKFLIFANNYTNQFCVSVEDSIATNSFSTAFFITTSSFYDPLELIHLGVPTPLKPIGLDTPVAYVPATSDATEQNLLVRNGWQFRIKWVDVYGRESEHGIISAPYITVVGGGCLLVSNGLPRGVMLNFEAGNPLVDKIYVEYRKWVGNDRAGALASGWQLYEVFDKYDNSANVEWYNRSLNPLFTTVGSGITYDATTNTFAYTFTADKNSIPVDPTETSRIEPELPRISAGVFAFNKRIGLFNNVRGFEPIAPAIVNKVAFGVQTPSSSPCAAPPTRTIKLLINVYNPYGDYSAICRQSYGKYVFGNSDSGGCDGGTSFQKGHTSSFKLGQVFADQVNPGFIVYLAGTPYKGITQQVDFDPATGAIVYQGMGSGISFPHHAMQMVTITDVPAGVYAARVSSHKSTINDPDYQKTSTYIAGTVPIYDLNLPGNRRHDMALFPYKEMIIDCTAGDVTLTNPTDFMFLLLDLGDGVKSGACDGYLYECPGGAPVEMNPIELGGITSTGTISDGYGSFFTDHNGFWFVTSGGKPRAAIWTNFCDGAGMVMVSQYIGNQSSIQHGNGSGSITGHCWGDDGNWTLGGAVFLKPTTYEAHGRRVIRQKFTTCTSSTIGVPGVPVVMTKGAVGVTDGTGTVSLIAHNRYRYNSSFPGSSTPYLGNLVPDFATSPGNTDQLIFSQKGGCTWTACGTCNTSIASATIQYIACFDPSIGCTGTVPPRTLCLTPLQVQMTGVGLYGCQTGGKYPVAIVLYDDIGRCTAPQVRQGQSAFVTMPNLNDVGYQQFALPSINVTIDPTFAVDPMYKRMGFLVGSNMAFSDFISWPADWVQPVDNTGETNSVNPTAIRLYYGSLNEYNKQNNFSANTGWEFITTGNQNGSPVEGDVIQFIMNGDGSWLPSVISAPVTYDQSGTFITIPYLPELAGLKNNCLFRVIRPVPNTSSDYVPFYEVTTIPLINGAPDPSQLSLVLPYFDSYLLTRLLPVPRLKGQPYAISPTSYPTTPNPILYTSSNQDATLDTSGYSTSNINNANGVVIFEVTDDPVSYPFLFESPSAADLWGSHIAFRGRVFFPNPSQAQQRSSTEVAISDELLDRGTLNYLSYFESRNVITFDANAWGGIVSAFVETSVILFITERDNFMVNYGTSNLKTDSQGNVVSQNQYGVFSTPERKTGCNYGCDPRDLNTIRRYAGIVYWLDRSGYVVAHNFGAAKAVQYNGYDGYISNKIATVNSLNSNPSNGLTYFIGGIDPKNWEYYFSSFNIPNSGVPNYINNTDEVNLLLNETLCLDLDSGILKGSPAFTPEYYGQMGGYYLSKNMFTFKGGQPYIHHNGINGGAPFNNFYGVQCKKIVRLVVNGGPDNEKVKRFMWNEVYCKEHKFVVSKVLTESGQQSRILGALWFFMDKFWTSDYKCDLNTLFDPSLPPVVLANPLYEGDTLYGTYAEVTYQSENADDAAYCELSSIVNYYIEETNSAK